VWQVETSDVVYADPAEFVEGIMVVDEVVEEIDVAEPDSGLGVLLSVSEEGAWYGRRGRVVCGSR
jgi:hypothetical protein